MGLISFKSPACLLSAVVLMVSGTLVAQDRPSIVPQDVYSARYICYRTVDQIEIDGKDGEESWRRATALSQFVDIEGDSKPKPTWPTTVKMVWSDTHLFLYAFLEQPHVSASLENHDDIIYRDDDFEIFIDPDDDTHHYFEFEFNALGTLLDLFLDTPYRDGGPMLIEWDAKGLEYAVHVHGSLNDGSDEDQGWSLEVAIPFTALKTHKQHPSPKDSTRWRINFSRVEWDHQWDGNEYTKAKDQNGNQLPEHNWTWSAQGIVNMHYPEMWGYMQFSTRPVGSKPVQFMFVGGDAERVWLRKVYYAQRLFKGENQGFSDSLDELLQYYDGFSGVKDMMALHSYPSGYECHINVRQNFGTYAINETGRVWKLAP